jgi:hypothetical protein
MKERKYLCSSLSVFTPLFNFNGDNNRYPAVSTDFDSV